MFTAEAEFYMERCLTLASKGKGKTLTNPMVGAVLVFNNTIIGEGWHKAYGESHAEVGAIKNCWAPEYMDQATLYVSLEPCSHHGKTPPCSDLILEHNIPKIVVGCLDPNPQVAGSGIAQLKNSGREVIVGVLQDKCEKLNAGFIKYHRHKSPFIHLKWAETKDGFIAPADHRPYWISHPLSKQWVHQLRSEHQAILIGVQTLLDDQPQLNVRLWKGNHPQVCVIDPKGRCFESPKLLERLDCPWIFTEANPPKSTNPQIQLFAWEGLEQLSRILYEKKIQSLLVEGGAKTIQYFIEKRRWDQATVFRSKKTFQQGILAPKINFSALQRHTFAGDEVNVYSNNEANIEDSSSGHRTGRLD
ncbi:MAG: bifunctional diaminohydroxyphosphoribosylaminopyrimidine deaminase/5-amino-6-(5-phosphoribosylamino)uracil reductase RibD [Flavobacteriaceae bacterium]